MVNQASVEMEDFKLLVQMEKRTHAGNVLWETETLSSCNQNLCCWCILLVDMTPHQSMWYFSWGSKTCLWEVFTVLSKLPDWGHCVVSVEVSKVSRGDCLSTAHSKLPYPGHIRVTACMNIWLMVCIVSSNFQSVSVKFWNYISVYKHTWGKVGIIVGSKIVYVLW